jgi:hypothetical protein
MCLVRPTSPALAFDPILPIYSFYANLNFPLISVGVSSSADLLQFHQLLLRGEGSLVVGTLLTSFLLTGDGWQKLTFPEKVVERRMTVVYRSL